MASKFSASRTSNSRMALLAPVLSDKCLRSHSSLYHLTHPIENCICERKICDADFAKVLKPIKQAEHMDRNLRNTILDIRKRHNNRNAAGAFRKRESESEKKQDSEIYELLKQKRNLEMEKELLQQEIYHFRARSLSCLSPMQHEFPDSDSDINITSPMSSDNTFM